MDTIIETVPNFSEGRDQSKIAEILDAFRGRRGVKLIDHEADPDHNRCVVTAVGEPGPLKNALLAAVGAAVRLIDLRVHRGQHPRMGAVDVIPFIPIRKATMEEAAALSKEVARAIAETYRIPVFLYEESASDPVRKNLADIRKGQFEGMEQKLKLPEWKPDFGEAVPHPSAGVVAVGARMPLVAFNVNLGTDNMEIANAIAKAVRHQSGGLRYCKAIGVDLKTRGMVQVSMNMTDFTRTPLYRVVELIRTEAHRCGVNIVGSEIVGMVPMAALVDAAAYYMGLEHFSIEQVLEQRLME
ncbi:MAG TPA: glutamate formimidoyltransferase [Syntrophorhabdales bacterium]|nr:glutamate formimidoyltransferase [Syntrophorhabdales bacterium]